MVAYYNLPDMREFLILEVNWSFQGEKSYIKVNDSFSQT